MAPNIVCVRLIGMYILSNQTDLKKFIIIHRKVVKVQESKLQSLGIKEYHGEK